MTQIKQLHQFIRFGISGVVGFLVDAGIVALCTQTIGMRPIPSQAVAFCVAVTVTWLINRNWTFAGHERNKWLHELTRYVASNSLGAAVNNGVYGMLVLTLTIFSRDPVLAVGAGSLAGMSFNFTLAKLFVFKTSPR